MPDWGSQFAVAITALDKTGPGVAAAQKSIAAAFVRPVGTLAQGRKEAEGLDKGVASIRSRIAATWHMGGLGRTADQFSDIKKLVGETTDATTKFASILGPAGGILAGGASLAGVGLMVERFARGAGDLGRSAGTIGTSTDALQKWRGSAELAGLSADDATASMRNLSQNMFQGSRGLNPMVASVAAEFRLNLAAPVDKFLLDVADKMKGMSAPRQHLLADILGITPLLPLLRKGSDAVREYTAETERHRFLAPEQIQAGEDLERAYQGATQSTLGFADAVSAHLAPSFTPLLNSYSAWLDDLKKSPAALDLTVTGIGLLATAVGLTLTATIWKLAGTVFSANAAILATPLGRLFLLGAAVYAGGTPKAGEGWGDFAKRRMEFLFKSPALPNATKPSGNGVLDWIDRFFGYLPPAGKSGGVTGHGESVPIPPPLVAPGSPGGALPPHAGLDGATDAEKAVLAQVRQREGKGIYDTFHATGGHVGSLADVDAFSGSSHAFGGYGFQPGTYREMGGGQDISPKEQDTAALALLRKYGPNSTHSWAASGPYDTAGLGAQQVGGFWSRLGNAIMPSAHAAPMPGFGNMSARPGVDLARINPALMDIGATAAAGLGPGYRAMVTSGERVGGLSGSRHHAGPGGYANAADFQIYGPDGQPIPNRGADTTGIYGRFAQLALGAQIAKYPKLAGALGWGGNFETSPGSGVPDLMHLDLGGDRGRYGRLADRGPLAPAEAAPAPQQYEPADTKHEVSVRFLDAPQGMRTGLTRADGPARTGVRVEYAMPGL